MTRHASIKRLFQAAAIVAIGGLAGAAHAANTAGFQFIAQGPEKPYNISKVVGQQTKRSTGAAVCNVFGTGIDVRTITTSTTVHTDLLAGCVDGTQIQRNKQGTNTTSADNILWCAFPGGWAMQGGVGIHN